MQAIGLRLSRYSRFFFVGSALGIAGILAREAIAVVLPESVIGYALSIIAVYIVAFVAGFLLQGKFAFQQNGERLRIASKAFVGYSAVSAFAGLLAAWTATVLLYSLTPEIVPEALRPSFCFAIASAAASVVAFALNEVFVFGVR
jgi:putative flippase GtrA